MTLLDNLGSVSGLFAVARAAHMTACAALASVFVFERGVVRQCGALPNRRWIVWSSIPILIISGFVWLIAATIDMTGLSATEACTRENFRLVLEQSDFGRLWLIRAGIVVGTLGAWAAMRAIRLGNKADAMFVGSVALLGSLAWAGHGSFGTWPMTHRVADIAHLLIIAIWPGGLLPLWLTLGGRIEVASVTAIVNRFSKFALVSVAILIASGWINSWMLVGSWRGLIDTPYGQTLLIKLGLLLGMLLLGAVNLLYLRPRICTEKSALRLLRWNVGIEALLMLGVMLVVGYLGLLQPAADL